MCGIAGFISTKPNKINENDLKTIISNMINCLHHRGPDSNGIWFSNNDQLVLGHTRLSILDLSPNGSQPMKSSTQRYVLIFNGEIYNHLSIREKINRDIPSKKWNGSSDTETIIESMELYGIKKTLENIEGMFAFAVWDNKEKNLTIARDRFGEKPLYYGFQNGYFFFASELTAILSNTRFKKDIDLESIGLHQTYGFIPQPKSILKDVFKLPPGTFMTFGKEDFRNIKPKKYWSIEDCYAEENRYKNITTLDQSVQKLDELLSRSIKSQLISDVPLGAFLSGGIDSSLVVSIMSNHITPKTFSIGFKDDIYDESKYAKDIANHLKTEHTEFILNDDDLLDVIPNLYKVYDEPFSDSSQIPTILLSKLTRKHVTVALSGDGADELFGGYNRHFYSKQWWPLINKIPFNLRNSFVKINQKFNFKNFNKNTKDINRLKKVMGALSSKDDLDLYMSYLSEGQSPEHLHNLKSQEKYINVEEYFKNFNIAEKLMILDTSYYLPDNVLVKVDRAAMSQSLETRAPYLNSELFNFAVSIPLDQKINGNKGKLVQKKLLESYIPNHLIDRPKQGFEPPLGDWLRGPLKEWSGDIINSHNALNREYYKKDIILKRWNQHQNNDTDWTKFLWNIISLESWRIENNI